MRTASVESASRATARADHKAWGRFGEQTGLPDHLMTGSILEKRVLLFKHVRCKSAMHLRITTDDNAGEKESEKRPRTGDKGSDDGGYDGDEGPDWTKQSVGPRRFWVRRRNKTEREKSGGGEGRKSG
jgi:hypothetical protein